MTEKQMQKLKKQWIMEGYKRGVKESGTKRYIDTFFGENYSLHRYFAEEYKEMENAYNKGKKELLETRFNQYLGGILYEANNLLKLGIGVNSDNRYTLNEIKNAKYNNADESFYELMTK